MTISAKTPILPESERFSVDDFSAAFIRLEGDITLDFHELGNGTWTPLATIPRYRCGLKVRQPLQPLGSAWDGPIGAITLMHDAEDGAPTHTEIPLDQEGQQNLFERKVRAFVDAVKTGGLAPIPTSQIIYNQAIIDGIIRSSASREEVKIEIPTI